MLTSSQRDVLIRHLDGAQPVLLNERHVTIRSLVRRGWLKFDRPTRPRTTSITPAGLAVLATSLKEWRVADERAEQAGYRL